MRLCYWQTNWFATGSLFIRMIGKEGRAVGAPGWPLGKLLCQVQQP